MTLESFMPGRMLHRAGVARGDVERQRDDLAGLAHLPYVRRVARVDRGTRGAEARVELVGSGASTSVNFSKLAMARPSDTMILAAVSWGVRSG